MCQDHSVYDNLGPEIRVAFSLGEVKTQDFRYKRDKCLHENLAAFLIPTPEFEKMDQFIAQRSFVMVIPEKI